MVIMSSSAQGRTFVQANREEQSCVGELSDDDDSCSDQVVYHNDHHENMFGLYSRLEEAKLGGHLQPNLLKTGQECFEDHRSLANPSDRETAVWGALEASESSLQEACHGPENDADQLWNYNSLIAPVGAEQLLRDCLGVRSTYDLEDKNIVAEDDEQQESSHATVKDDVNRAEVQLRDEWDHVNADIDDIHEQVVGPSSIQPKRHCFVKPKGSTKKRLSLNFRTFGKVTRVQQSVEQSDDHQKLSLAQKLQSLAEPSSIKTEMQAVPKCSDPCSRVPMSMKFFELVQNDARNNCSKKARKKPDAAIRTSSKLCIKEQLGERTNIGEIPSESINDQFRKALLDAPLVSADEMNRQGEVHGTLSGFAARLQKVLERERNNRADFLRMLQTRQDSLEGKLGCMDVKIISKSLEARLSACECNILKYPEAYGADINSYFKVMVIFNMQANTQMELETGTVVRLYPPWKEVLVQNGSETVRTLLCTYFCEVLAS